MAISKNVTINQIAQLANVSTATASRVINQPNSVKPETRNKVLKAMKELNYQSKRDENKLILASFTNFVNPFYNECIAGMQAAARQRGYQLFLQQIEDNNSWESYSFLLNNQLFQGIIFTHTIPTGEILDNIQIKYPIVMCSQYNEGNDLPCVIIDDYVAAQNAINYLLSIGKRKIAMLNSPLSRSYAVLREKAYRETLQNADIEIPAGWIIYVPDIDFDIAYSAALNLLSNVQRPDAIFCVSDVFASAALKAAHQLNLTVPSDVAIMGFDNVSISTMTTPTLSTVNQPTYQLGWQSCNMLIDQIEENPIANKKIVLNTEIVVRSST